MNEPITPIDPRYSDPNAVATPWETCRVLETAELLVGRKGDAAWQS